jgi:hypothetical protein
LNVEAAIDSFDTNKRVPYPKLKSAKDQTIQLALGNQPVALLNKKISTAALLQKHFHGICSLPLFCQGIPDTHQS